MANDRFGVVGCAVGNGQSAQTENNLKGNIMETSCINIFCIKASAILLGFLIGLCTAPVFAVHDEEFELDHVPNVGANIVNDGVLNVDWADLFDANYPSLPTTKPARLSIWRPGKANCRRCCLATNG